MRVTCCSLRFGTAYADYALLDDHGELLESGHIRISKPALWNRFAALSRAVIAVNYDPRNLWAVELLGELGHMVMFSGDVPAGLRQELKPVVGDVDGTAVLCPGKQAEKPGVHFVVQTAKAAITSAHYVIGPISATSEVRGLVTFLSQAAPQGVAEEQASVVYRLLNSGLIELPAALAVDAVVAA